MDSKKSQEIASTSRRQLLQWGAVASALLAAPTLADAATGSAQAKPVGEAVVPFKIQVPQAAIDDLKLRLRHTRWPEHETQAAWAQGVPRRRRSR